MSPERWERVKQVVDACLELDPPARERDLDSACAADRELRSEV